MNNQQEESIEKGENESEGEDGESQRGNSHRCWQVETENRELGSAKVGDDGVVFDESSQDHQTTGQNTCKTDAHLIEDKPREEEHQQEDVDETACAGEETIVGWCPSKTSLFSGEFEQGLQWRHHIIDEIPHHHSRCYDE